MDDSGEVSGVIWRFSDIKMGSVPTTLRVVADDGTEDSVSFYPFTI